MKVRKHAIALAVALLAGAGLASAQTATGTGAYAAGAGATATSTAPYSGVGYMIDPAGLGRVSSLSVTGSTAVGENAVAKDGDTVVGTNAANAATTATNGGVGGGNAIFGAGALASSDLGRDSLVGYGSWGAGLSSAFGYRAHAGESGVAIGWMAWNSTVGAATSVGARSFATGYGSTGIGYSTEAAEYGFAAGFGARATGLNSSAIGARSWASAVNSTSIGYESANIRDNTISFGSAGNERQLTNVAGGAVATDAANMQNTWSARDAAIGSAAAYTDSAVSPLAGQITSAQTKATDATARADAAYTLADQTHLLATSNARRLDVQDAQLSEHDTLLASHDVRIATNTARLDGNDVTLADHETRIASNTTRLDGNDVTLADHDKRITSNTSRLAQHDVTLADHETRTATNERHLQEHDVRLDQHDLTLADHGQRISTAQATADAAHSRIDSVEGRVGALESKVSAMPRDYSMGIAGVAAMTAPMPALAPGERALVLGTGGYNGYTSIGAVVAYNFRGSIVSAGIARGAGGAVWKANASFKF